MLAPESTAPDGLILSQRRAEGERRPFPQQAWEFQGKMEIKDLSLSPHFPKGLQHRSWGPTSFHPCPYFRMRYLGRLKHLIWGCNSAIILPDMQPRKRRKAFKAAMEASNPMFLIICLWLLFPFMLSEAQRGKWVTLPYIMLSSMAMWRRVILPHASLYPCPFYLAEGYPWAPSSVNHPIPDFKVHFLGMLIVWIIISVRFPAGNIWHTHGRITQEEFIY